MKILYLSCHSILEYDEVKLLSELGHEVFSPGAYVEPANPGDASLRPGINNLNYDPEIREQYRVIDDAHPGKDGKEFLTKEFVDNFDCVIVMHLPRWIEKNWEVMKHKTVIWRTIGQSVSHNEQQLAPYRKEGLKIVRYSPMERFIPGYIGGDAMIRFYKDPDEYNGWNGGIKKVITLAQSMQQRDIACNFSLFEEVTRPYPRMLFGKGNEGVAPWAVGEVSYSQLKEELKNNRAYFYTGTHPASYTLNFIESLMTGIPVVAIGPAYGNAQYYPGHFLYEVGGIIKNGVNGFVSDNKAELSNSVKMLLEDEALAKEISAKGRETAIQLFGKDTVKEQWKNYLQTL